MQVLDVFRVRWSSAMGLMRLGAEGSLGSGGCERYDTLERAGGG